MESNGNPPWSQKNFMPKTPCNMNRGNTTIDMFYTVETPRTAGRTRATGEGTSGGANTVDNDGNSLNPNTGGLFLDTTRGGLPLAVPKMKTNNRPMNIGTWNVRTMKDPGKLHLLMKELEFLGMNITGLSEVRWGG